jgi:hypothetical protein
MLEGLVGRFRDVLQILQDEGVPEPGRLAKIRETLGDPAEALAQCNEHIAYAGQFDMPFTLVPYRTQRSLLFLRRTIHAATNKSEQFNDFAQWLMFGGECVIAENVRH